LHGEHGRIAADAEEHLPERGEILSHEDEEKKEELTEPPVVTQEIEAPAQEPSSHDDEAATDSPHEIDVSPAPVLSVVSPPGPFEHVVIHQDAKSPAAPSSSNEDVPVVSQHQDTDASAALDSAVVTHDETVPAESAAEPADVEFGPFVAASPVLEVTPPDAQFELTVEDPASVPLPSPSSPNSLLVHSPPYSALDVPTSPRSLDAVSIAESTGLFSPSLHSVAESEVDMESLHDALDGEIFEDDIARSVKSPRAEDGELEEGAFVPEPGMVFRGRSSVISTGGSSGFSKSTQSSDATTASTSLSTDADASSLLSSPAEEARSLSETRSVKSMKSIRSTDEAPLTWFFF
jgi:hypothetical protein